MKMWNTRGGRPAAGSAMIALAILAGAAMVAMAQEPDLEELLAVARSEVTAVEIIKWGEDHQGVAKFDTRTGEIWRFNGDVLKSNTKAEWILEVPAVAERAVGTLRLQHANTGGLFLVDAVTGDTWLLRERASDNFGWVAVRNYSSVLTSGSR